jgi:HD superfamily phosphohydrolase
MTYALMDVLNEEYDGALDTAISIFNDQYHKKFLHQLVSSQLDIDRLDYLKRDSTFTGVYEGSIGIDRILRTMRVHKGNIVIEQKGLYAIENYVISRRLMYLQVYQHKTVLSADKLLRSIFDRVRQLVKRPGSLSIPSVSLEWFIRNDPDSKQGLSKELISHYVQLDDNDVIMSIKSWSTHTDTVLRDLSSRYLNRNLLRCTFLEKQESEIQKKEMIKATKRVLLDAGLPNDDATVHLYLQFGSVSTETYKNENDRIWILDDSSKQAVEFSNVAETKNISVLTKPLIRHYVIHHKKVKVV